MTKHTAPTGEEEWADFLYEIQNYTDAKEKAKFVYALFSRLTAERDTLQNTIDVLESNARVQAKLLADTGRERDGLRRALQASTDRVQRFLDTFGDLGDCVTQADVSDWREVLATPTDPDAESRGQD